MPPRPILVFDLDDTLYAERQFAISGFRACERWLIERHGPTARGIVPDMIRRLDEGHMRALFEIALASRVPNPDPAQLEAFIDVYREHTPDIALYPDAAWALDHFARLGPLGLITDGQASVQSSKVRALGIAQRFRSIVYTHALGGRDFSKPHPLAYEQTEAAMASTDAARFVYIGDNPAKDFLTPNQRGWITVQVLKPFRIHARATPLVGGAPQHVIEALSQLPEVLAGLGA